MKQLTPKFFLPITQQAKISSVSNHHLEQVDFTMLNNAIFSAADVATFSAANKKLVLEEKQRLLQEWAADALVDGILTPYSVYRPLRHDFSRDAIKAELASGKTTALIWTAKHAIFKKDSSTLGSDCRSEIYQGKTERHWAAYDENDRRREITVEDVARWSNVHETLHDRRPEESGSVSFLAVIKHTDFLYQLASRFGDKFTCSYTIEQSGEETQYWTPYVIKVFLHFCPKGVEKKIAEKIATAAADFQRRSETIIISTCHTCKKGLTRHERIESSCLKDCRCHEHDCYFCSDKCIGPYFRRAV